MYTTKHQFHTELLILEANPPLECNLLIIGTFNADIEKNLAKWFYGRSESEFWFLLPRALAKPSLYASDLNKSLHDASISQREFCEKFNIKIVDVFKAITTEKPLKSHADKHLKLLNADMHVPFDYKKAFGSCNIKVVAFTWKSGSKNERKNIIKAEIIKFFSSKNVPCISLVSPSQAAPGGRFSKLKQWTEALSPFVQLT